MVDIQPLIAGTSKSRICFAGWLSVLRGKLISRKGVLQIFTPVNVSLSFTMYITVPEHVLQDLNNIYLSSVLKTRFYIHEYEQKDVSNVDICRWIPLGY